MVRPPTRRTETNRSPVRKEEGTFGTCREPSLQTRLQRMKNKPRLTDVMTPDPKTVHIGQPLSDAYTLLQDQPFRHLPVVDGDAPVGMISSTDILKLVYDVEGSDDRMLRTMLDHQFTLEDAMTTDLVSVSTSDSLRAVADHMAGGDHQLGARRRRRRQARRDRHEHRPHPATPRDAVGPASWLR